MRFFDFVRRVLPARSPAEPLARGTFFLERGRLDEAGAAFAEALAAATTPAERAAVRNKRAIVALRRGDRGAAIDELTRGLEAEPRSAPVIVTTGNLLLEDGALDEAIAHYEYALLIDQDYAPAYHNLGVALHRSGRRGEAVRMLRKATSLERRIRR